MSWAAAFSLVVAVAAPEVEGPVAPAEESTISLAADAEGPDGPVPAWVLWRDYVRVKRPKTRGTGLMIAAGATYGVGILAQLADIAFNDGLGSGFVDRLFIGPAMILAPIGGYLRGRDDAFVDASLGRRRKVKGLMAAGLTLAGIGAIAGLANEGMWWQCWISGEGPYYIEPPPDVFVPQTVCRSGVARLALDASALLVGGGLAMGLWGLKYRKDSRSYERAVLAVVPRVQTTQVGLGIVGSF
ncbi:MAG: hypothetical protein KC486_18335 [Myxococcales bacterium]|nr:hypothetical protein [Myxococcales bacterium]